MEKKHLGPGGIPTILLLTTTTTYLAFVLSLPRDSTAEEPSETLQIRTQCRQGTTGALVELSCDAAKELFGTFPRLFVPGIVLEG